MPHRPPGPGRQPLGRHHVGHDGEVPLLVCGAVAAVLAAALLIAASPG